MKHFWEENKHWSFTTTFHIPHSNPQAWFSPKRRGLVASIVVSGYGFGSCIWTPLQTLYINPDNLNATSDNNTSCGDNKTKYYQDEGEQLKYKHHSL